MSEQEMQEYQEYAQTYVAAIQLQQNHYAALNNISGASTIAASNQGFDGQQPMNSYSPGMQLSHAQATSSPADVREMYGQNLGDSHKPIFGHDPYRRHSGILSNFKDDRGFGWLKSSECTKIFGKDVFVHRGDI